MYVYMYIENKYICIYIYVHIYIRIHLYIRSMCKSFFLEPLRVLLGSVSSHLQFLLMEGR
jgi:hypothetical protein